MAQSKRAIYSDPEQVVATPAIDGLTEVAETLKLLKEATDLLEKRLRDPLAVMTWYEGHPVGHIMMAHGRKPNSTMTLYNVLARYGVDTTARVVTGHRKRGVEEIELPDGLKETPEDLGALRTLLDKILQDADEPGLGVDAQQIVDEHEPERSPAS